MLVVGQELPQVAAVRAEHRGPMGGAVDDELADRGGQAVDVARPGSGRGSAGWPGRSTLASRRRAFSPLCLALIRARRRLCEPTAHRKCTVPGQPLDVGLLVGVLTGQVHEVGEPEAASARRTRAGSAGSSATSRSIVAVSSPATHSTGPSLRTADRLVWVAVARAASPKRSRTVRSTVMADSVAPGARF